MYVGATVLSLEELGDDALTVLNTFQIAKSIEEVYKLDECFLTITLDLEAITKLQVSY